MRRGEKKRQYTEDDKAVALACLAANDGNVLKTAQFTGVPRQTIQRWIAGKAGEAVAAKTASKKLSLADTLEEKVWLLAGAIDAERIDEAALVQVTTALGTLVDKMRLLREQATNINEHVHLSDNDRIERIAELLDAARARRDRPAAGVCAETSTLPS